MPFDALLTDTFLQAYSNPLGPVSETFLSDCFKFVPEDQRPKVIRANEISKLAHGIAGFFSTFDKPYDRYGNYVNVLSHIVLSNILSEMNNENEDIQNYIKRVYAAADKVFECLNDNTATPLRQLNFSNALQEIDVPGDIWAENIVLSMEGHEQDEERLKEIFKKAFKTATHVTGESINETAFRAVPGPEEHQEIITIVTRIIVESEIFTDTSALIATPNVGCVILEGRDVSSWVNKNVKSRELTTEEKAQFTTLETLEKHKIETLFQEAVDRMNKYKEMNPVLPLVPTSLAVFPNQTVYTAAAGVKHNVEGPVDEAREFILPGIEKKKYITVLHLRLPLQPVDPLKVHSKNISFISYLQQIQNFFHNTYLDLAIRHLKRDDANRECNESFKALRSRKIAQN